MLFEIIFRRIIEIQADSYNEAEDKALNELHHLMQNNKIAEVFDILIHKEEIDLSTMGGG